MTAVAGWLTGSHPLEAAAAVTCPVAVVAVWRAARSRARRRR